MIVVDGCAVESDSNLSDSKRKTKPRKKLDLTGNADVEAGSTKGNSKSIEIRLEGFLQNDSCAHDQQQLDVASRQ